jgi:hypothetical protein
MRLLGRASLDLERGAHRPLGVVLVGDRCPEHRHERVAYDLVHGAAEPVDDLAHLAHAPIDHRADLLRVRALRQRREPRQIGEHDRHPPPLPIDAVDGVRRGRRAGVARGTACPAETEPRRVIFTARGALVAERRSALAAEALRGVVYLAADGAGGLLSQG